MKCQGLESDLILEKQRSQQLTMKADEAYEKFKMVEFERIKLQSEVQGLQKSFMEGNFKIVRPYLTIGAQRC